MDLVFGLLEVGLKGPARQPKLIMRFFLVLLAKVILSRNLD